MNDALKCVRCKKAVDACDEGCVQVSTHWGLCAECRGMDEFEEAANAVEGRGEVG